MTVHYKIVQIVLAKIHITANVVFGGKAGTDDWRVHLFQWKVCELLMRRNTWIIKTKLWRNYELTSHEIHNPAPPKIHPRGELICTRRTNKQTIDLTDVLLRVLKLNNVWLSQPFTGAIGQGTESSTAQDTSLVPLVSRFMTTFWNKAPT